jgi:DNA-binding transcriptional MerR regulator
MFLTYRGLLLDFINHFLVPKIHSFFNYPKVKVKFKEFKMTDDAQAKQLMLQLSEYGKISDKHLLDSFGFNYDEVQEAIKESESEARKSSIKNILAQAEAKGQASVTAAKYSVKAQMASQREMLKERISNFQKEIERENGEISGDFIDLIERMALQVIYTPPEMQVAQLGKLAKQAPTTHALVMERVQMYQESGLLPSPESVQKGPGNPQAQSNPPNKKNPGARKENKVDTSKQKTKGNTRGTPT